MEFIVENMELSPLQNGKFVQPFSVSFSLNGNRRNWELVKADDSVAILIYNRDSNSFVCVRQFRPPVFINDKSTNGVTLELCAGILDKDLTLAQIASEEIIEETGFQVDADDLEKITSFSTAVGVAGTKQHLYYAEVDESCRVSCGGGVADEELIEVVEIPLEKAKELMFDETIPKTPGLLFAFEWFLNKRSK
jgi:UDP-sugar diphosphatase